MTVFVGRDTLIAVQGTGIEGGPLLSVVSP